MSFLNYSKSPLPPIDSNSSPENQDIPLENDLTDATVGSQFFGQLRTYSLPKSENYGIKFAVEPASHQLVYPMIELDNDLSVSPAKEAGMRNGQRLVAVDNRFINKDLKTLGEVKQAIKDSNNSNGVLSLLVFDPDLLKNPFYAGPIAGHSTPNKEIKKRSKSKQPPDERVNPRSCQITRKDPTESYGFEIIKIEDHYAVKNVKKGLSADLAGLQDKDCILEVNGEKIRGLDNATVVKKLMSKPNRIDLLVVSDYQGYLKNSKIESRKRDFKEELRAGIENLDWDPEVQKLLRLEYKKNLIDPSLTKEVPVPKVSKPKKRAKRFDPNKLKPLAADSSLLKTNFRKWLDLFSLEAKQLTIFDVLLSMSESKISSIKDFLFIDDLVNARIWSEIIELAESVGVDKTRFKFIKISLQDLKQYQKDLQTQITIYKKRLMAEIWKYLPELDKAQFGSPPPVEYDASNCEKLLGSLEKSNWPVKLEDIKAYEAEIERGYKYLSISKDLEKYMAKKIETDKTKVDPVNQQIEEDEKKKAEKNTISEFSVNEIVIARSDLFGYYYSGKLVKIDKKRKTATVRLKIGAIFENISFKNMIKIEKDQKWDYFEPGQFVMLTAKNELGQECYMPGVVQLKVDDSIKMLYTILVFNGQEVNRVRNQLVKINKSQYGSIVNFIRVILRKSTWVDEEEEKPETPKPEIPRSPSPLPENTQGLLDYFESLEIDGKYNRVKKELEALKKKQDDYKKDLQGDIKELRNDMKGFKKPPKESPKIDKPRPLSPNELTYDKKIKNLKKNLSKLRPGEEVLVKWPRDGYYYRCIVQKDMGDFKYLVENKAKLEAIAYREDILSEINEALESFEEGDAVIALYSEEDFKYAPAKVVRINSTTSDVCIEFFDRKKLDKANRKNIFKMPISKFQLDVDTIKQFEANNS